MTDAHRAAMPPADSPAATPDLPADLAMGTLRTARAIAVEVADELLRLRAEFSRATDKGDVDVVTQADGHSEARVTKALAEAFPRHRIAGEEGTVLGPADSPWTWHVDPLDGTANYSRGIPYWSISVGLAFRHRPVLGVVVGPACGVLVSGVVGLGAWDHDRPLPPVTPAPAEEKRWIIASDWPWDLAERQRTLGFLAELAPRIRQFKTMGSAALDCSLLALGLIDAYAIPKVFPWDLCAGTAALTALGHDLLDWDGHPWDLRRGDIIAARPGMAPALTGAARAATAAVARRAAGG